MHVSLLRNRITRNIGLVLIALGLTACATDSSTPGSASEPAPGQHTTTVTDVLGRQVTVPVPARRMLLDGARMLYTTALLNPKDPTAGIVGWPDDLEQNDPDTYREYQKKFPAISSIPKTGQLYDGSFSVERAVSLRPDVFVVSAANFQAAKDAGTIDKLQSLGIPTVVVDYFTDPLRNTAASVELMGRLTGHDAEAKQYVDYYRAMMGMVRSRLDTAHRPPTRTFLWRAPGYFDCCSSFARSNLGSMVSFAGGDNLGDRFLNTRQGTLSPETVLSQQPAVVIATGANWAPGTPAKQGGFIPLGYDSTTAQAQQQLGSVVARQAGFDQLSAVKEHRTYAVWHHFYDSPYNCLAVLWFAKWQHPDLFTDIDPDTTFRELHQRFLPIAPRGAFWAGLA